MSFFSHRDWRTASLVTFAIYLVFFMSSPSPPPPVLAVVAATMADAEFTCDVVAVAVAVFWVEGWVFDLPIVTVVQSWQSGV